MNLEITLSNKDQAAICEQVTQSLIDALCKVNPSSLRKHAYTVKEVAEQIGYSEYVVRQMIRDGRRAVSGKLIKLPAKEITKGDYRILPAELDWFLAQF